MTVTETAAFVGADVPADQTEGRQLGRTVNYEHAVGIYGRPEPRVHHQSLQHRRRTRLSRLPSAQTLKGRGKAMFDQAIAHGIDTAVDPPAELVALFAEADNVPTGSIGISCIAAASPTGGRGSLW